MNYKINRGGNPPIKPTSWNYKNTNLKKLLSNGATNTKTAKNDIKTFILYLAPHTQNSKGITLCRYATIGCIKACLFSAGRGKFTNVQTARTEKANYFVEYKKEFLNHLAKEINTKVKTARRKGEKIAFRLNGTSDIDFVYLLKKHANFDILDTKDVAIFTITPQYTRAIRYKTTHFIQLHLAVKKATL